MANYIAPYFDIIMNAVEANILAQSIIENDLSCLIGGHETFPRTVNIPKGVIRYFTMLRDPWTRFQSCYKYTYHSGWHRLNPDAFYEQSQKNVYVECFGKGDYDVALESLLNEYECILILEKMPESIELLKKHFGFSINATTALNVSRNTATLFSDSLKSKFLRDNEPDFILYNDITQRFYKPTQKYQQASNIACSNSDKKTKKRFMIQAEYMPNIMLDTAHPQYIKDRLDICGTARLTKKEFSDLNISYEQYFLNKMNIGIYDLIDTYKEDNRTDRLESLLHAIRLNPHSYNLQKVPYEYTFNRNWDSLRSLLDAKDIAQASPGHPVPGASDPHGFRHFTTAIHVYSAISKLKPLLAPQAYRALLSRHKDDLMPVLWHVFELQDAIASGDHDAIPRIVDRMEGYAKDPDFLPSVLPVANRLRTMGFPDQARRLIDLQLQKDFFIYEAFREKLSLLCDMGRTDQAYAELRGLTFATNMTRIDAVDIGSLFPSSGFDVVISAAPPLLLYIFLKHYRMHTEKPLLILTNKRHLDTAKTFGTNVSFIGLPDKNYAHDTDASSIDPSLFDAQFNNLFLLTGNHYLEFCGELLKLAASINATNYFCTTYEDQFVGGDSVELLPLDAFIQKGTTAAATAEMPA